jgi:hypothetical protein
MKTGRFPAPLTLVDYHDACFIVMDASGVAVARVSAANTCREELTNDDHGRYEPGFH